MAKMPKQKPYRSKQDYATPPEFMRAVESFLNLRNGFTFDFAASAHNAKAPRYWTQKDDSLSKNAAEWRKAVGDGWGWLNPPFARIGDWAARCSRLKNSGGQVALLVPASVGANWFSAFVYGQAQVIFLNGRIAFDPARPTWGFPKDCMLCIYSPEWDADFTVWRWKDDI